MKKYSKTHDLLDLKYSFSIVLKRIFKYIIDRIDVADAMLATKWEVASKICCGQKRWVPISVPNISNMFTP